MTSRIEEQFLVEKKSCLWKTLRSKTKLINIEDCNGCHETSSGEVVGNKLSNLFGKFDLKRHQTDPNTAPKLDAKGWGSDGYAVHVVSWFVF